MSEEVQFVCNRSSFFTHCITVQSKPPGFKPLEAAMQLGIGLQQARELEAVVSPMRAAPSLDSSAADGDFARLLDSAAAPSRQLSGRVQSPALTRLDYAS